MRPSEETQAMAVENRIKSLREKHRALDGAIRIEAARPLPDAVKVQEWKREKLRIKDTITELDRTPHV
jgi:hypothetical protein